MKKFIFGVMLLVSLLGIVGCSNPSNSDGSENDTENVVYTLKNGLTDRDLNPISMTISYKNKSGVYVNEQTIPADGTYKIPANDAKIDIKTFEGLAGSTDSPVNYLKITVGGTTVEGFIEVAPGKVVYIHGLEKNESGNFYHVEIKIEPIEN